MGHRQKISEPMKFLKCLGCHKSTECHQCLKSGRCTIWGHCLKWESERLSEHHALCWWRSSGGISWPPLQMMSLLMAGGLEPDDL